MTTGGAAGLILTLEKPKAGFIELHTAQRDISCRLRTLGAAPRTWACGGLRKQIQVYRLPAESREVTMRVPLDLAKLGPGDNPIYVRITQEDGHMAWSSPMYVVR